MARSVLNTRIQYLILEGAGVQPTIPDPNTLTPLDAGWNDATDIMVGELAYNKTDSAWYFRKEDNTIGSFAVLDAGVIKTLYESNADTNAFTDAYKAKLDKVLTNDASTLTDGAAITWDFNSESRSQKNLSTAQGTIAMTVLNANANTSGICHLIKTLSGDCVITISGTGYKFVDMDNKALPAANVVLTLSDTVNFYFEIVLMVTGHTDGGDIVITATLK